MEAGKPVKSMAAEAQRRKGRSPKQGIETILSSDGERLFGGTQKRKKPEVGH